MYKMKQHDRMKELFDHWLFWTLERKKEKAEEQIAIIFQCRHLMKNSFSLWRAYSLYRSEKALKNAAIIEKFNQIKHKLLSKSIYQLWKSKTSKLIDANLKEKMATSHHRQKLLKNSLKNWLEYQKEKKRKKLLMSKASSFLDMRVKTEYYFKWTCSFAKNMNMLDKNQQALVFWSINIQRSCFAAWFEWYKYKKHKKRCYDEAIKTRQIDILKVCAKNFLKYAMDSKLRRLNANKLLKERDLHSLSNLEFKYFNIWYEKVKSSSKNTSKPENKICSPRQNKLDKKMTLERVERINDTDYSQIKTDKINKIRTAPRKPTFLLDSIDINANDENRQDMSSKVHASERVEMFKANLNTSDNEKLTAKKDTTKKGMFVESPSTKILLPPSAFAVPLSFQAESIRIENQPPASFKQATFTDSKPIFIHSIEESSVKNQSKSPKTSKQKQNETRKCESELVELKKRLELLYDKSEKLK
jgi:hypothetical protein